ncbi:MAG: MerR family transcriptional regulator [Bacilli bacterium]|jgi:DNA-binding transcriptional MerR regulator|nr:MerR family transcriptional regulator [Bacilli bacterium]
MKIGEFSKITGLSESSIRFYVKHCLLSPSKEGSQYDFSKADVEVVKKIKILKEAGLSITEISKFFFPYIITSQNDPLTDEQRGILNKKLEILAKKQKEIRESQSRIEDLLTDKMESSPKTCGFALSALEYVICPKCGGRLRFSNCSIDGNSISTADAKCEQCGTTLEIRDGVLFPDYFKKDFSDSLASQFDLSSNDWGDADRRESDRKAILYQQNFNEELINNGKLNGFPSFLISNADNSLLILKCFCQLPKSTLLFIQGGRDLLAIKKTFGDFSGHKVAYIFSDEALLPIKEAVIFGASSISFLPYQKPKFQKCLSSNAVLFDNLIERDKYSLFVKK